MEVIKVIIAGSRDIDDVSLVDKALHDSGLLSKHLNGEIELQVVSGMARGIDTNAVEVAEKHGLKLHKFPCTKAMWDLHGKKAGILRNIEMGKFSNALVAIWDGESRGTKQMIDWATKDKKFVYVTKVTGLVSKPIRPVTKGL